MIQSLCSCLKDKHLCVDSFEHAMTNPTQQEGFITKGQVWKLKRSIYGLKQSSCCWNSVLDTQLKKMGFIQAASDSCIYITPGGEMFLIGVAGKSDERMKVVKKILLRNSISKIWARYIIFLFRMKIQKSSTEIWNGSGLTSQYTCGY